MRSYFEERAQQLFSRLQGDEVLLLRLQGESSDFVRFNHARVRQSGHVQDARLGLTLTDRKRKVQGQESLSGDQELDDKRLAAMLAELRGHLAVVPEDPFLLISESDEVSERTRREDIGSADAVVDQVSALAGERDFVGIYAGGDIQAGFASSLGQRSWFDSRTFHLDWSLFRDGDRAVKSSYAGFTWEDDSFARRMHEAGQKYEALGRPARALSPGAYRRGSRRRPWAK